jgi:ABC-type nitrate/sulfonate/bicarbonate transport system permease component
MLLAALVATVGAVHVGLGLGVAVGVAVAVAVGVGVGLAAGNRNLPTRVNQLALLVTG